MELDLPAFMHAWLDFIAAISRLCANKVDRARSRGAGELLRSLLADVTGELIGREDDIAAVIQQSVFSFDERNHEASVIMVQRLVTEMRAVTMLANSADAEHTDGAIDSAKTVKESLEKFLKRRGVKLPPWLKSALEVLNELLSIVKAVA